MNSNLEVLSKEEFVGAIQSGALNGSAGIHRSFRGEFCPIKDAGALS